ncbi:hypothetical protein [Pinirhizobacter soli]|uniref:hypothetical protein n=1 Tax=Pinirhizobacter soli TaxID=2786953 RepID=UPI002029D930|nr:hypothetical protein [Pinirhizobacter soli]
MKPQLEDFLEQFSNMDTNVLLLRYRAGGMVPDAEAALLEVLEGRGYSLQALLMERRAKVTTADVMPTDPPWLNLPPLPRVKSSDPRLRGFNRALKWLLIPVIVALVLLALPLVGNFLVLGGVGALGCNTGEDAIHPCHVLGRDIGSLVSGYGVSIFVLGGLNPFLAMEAFAEFLQTPYGVAWLLAVGGTLKLRSVKRGRLERAIDAQDGHL